MSSYLECTPQFQNSLREVAGTEGRRAFSLDINNIHVNAVNHGIDARVYLAAILGTWWAKSTSQGFRMPAIS